MRPGRAWILNDPYRGGTHLPDITVILPVFAAGDPDLLGFAAVRAHHADVGWPDPGLDAGRQPDARRRGRRDRAAGPRRRRRSTELAEQMRQPAQRRADLRAQLAAARTGVRAAPRAPWTDRRRGVRRRPGRGPRTTPSAAPGPACGAPRRRAQRRGCAGGRRRRPADPARGDGRGDPLTLDFTGTAAQHARQPQLPAGGHRLGLPVRAAGAHRPGDPAQRRRARGDRR